MKFPHIIFFFLLLAFSNANADLYKWVDSAGEVYYSDVIPAVVSLQGHTELNPQGITVKTVPAAPSPEDLAARKRQETLAKLRNALENQQQERDQHLLDNYTDIDELEAVFKTKAGVLAKSTKSIEERRDALESRLAAIKTQVEKAEDASQRKKLESYIQDAEETLVSYNYAIQENQTEQDLLRQHYEQDRTRLVKLLNESPSSPRPDPSTVPAKQRAQLAHQ